MASTQDTFMMSASGEMLEVLDRFKLDQKVETVKEDPVQRQILRIVLKYEMQSLLQRLAEIGEESVVVTANLVDGTHSVLASDHGEKFLHNGVVSNFMDHFVRYLYTGETPGSVREASSSSDAYMLKYGAHRQENNLSRSSVSSSEEPETFMHMKKHQIEQFNRRKDHEDRAIDETVSKLVKNILREGKAKERRNNTPPGSSFGHMKRKRMFSECSVDNAGSVDPETCSVPKKKPIAEYFPTLSPMLGGNSSGNVSNSFHHTIQQTEHSNSETPGDEVITIKIEPHDIEEYGGASDIGDKNKADSGSQEKDLEATNSSNCSSQEQTSQTIETPRECSQSVKSNGSNDIVIVQSNVEIVDGCENSGNSSSSQVVAERRSKTCEKIKVKIEEDIDLPFVEEYYQNRRKCLEDVKLTPEEIGTDQPTSTNAVDEEEEYIEKLPDPVPRGQFKPISLSSGKPTYIMIQLNATDQIRVGEMPHITQIAAVEHESGSVFERYIIPKVPMSNTASVLTGIVMTSLYTMRVKDKPVMPVPLQEAVEDFFRWLESFSNVLLVAHNGKRFDFPILTWAIAQLDLFPRFLSLVVGMIDPLLLFRKAYPDRYNHKLEGLVSDILKTTYIRHDAVEDVKSLGKLLLHTSPVKKWLGFSFPVKDVYHSTLFNKEKAKNIKSLHTLIAHGVCKIATAENIAGSGLNFDHLKTIFNIEGEDGLENALTDENSEGQPRVTNARRTLETIIPKMGEFFSKRKTVE